MQDLTQGYFEMLVEHGDPYPEGIESCEVPYVNEVMSGSEAVTVSI